MAGRKYLGPYSDAKDLATKEKVDAAGGGGGSLESSSESDDTVYSQADTTYVLKKTITFSVSATCVGLISFVSQIKQQYSQTGYFRLDLDDVQVAEKTTTSSSYLRYAETIPAALSSGSHTLKIYIKGSSSGTTGFMQAIRFAFIGVPVS